MLSAPGALENIGKTNVFCKGGSQKPWKRQLDQCLARVEAKNLGNTSIFARVEANNIGNNKCFWLYFGFQRTG